MEFEEEKSSEAYVPNAQRGIDELSLQEDQAVGAESKAQELLAKARELIKSRNAKSGIRFNPITPYTISQVANQNLVESEQQVQKREKRGFDVKEKALKLLEKANAIIQCSQSQISNRSVKLIPKRDKMRYMNPPSTVPSQRSLDLGTNVFISYFLHAIEIERLIQLNKIQISEAEEMEGEIDKLEETNQELQKKLGDFENIVSDLKIQLSQVREIKNASSGQKENPSTENIKPSAKYEKNSAQENNQDSNSHQQDGGLVEIKMESQLDQGIQIQVPRNDSNMVQYSPADVNTIGQDLQFEKDQTDYLQSVQKKSLEVQAIIKSTESGIFPSQSRPNILPVQRIEGFSNRLERIERRQEVLDSLDNSRYIPKKLQATLNNISTQPKRTDDHQNLTQPGIKIIQRHEWLQNPAQINPVQPPKQAEAQLSQQSYQESSNSYFTRVNSQMIQLKSRDTAVLPKTNQSIQIPSLSILARARELARANPELSKEFQKSRLQQPQPNTIKANLNQPFQQPLNPNIANSRQIDSSTFQVKATSKPSYINSEKFIRSKDRDSKQFSNQGMNSISSSEILKQSYFPKQTKMESLIEPMISLEPTLKNSQPAQLYTNFDQLRQKDVNLQNPINESIEPQTQISNYRNYNSSVQVQSPRVYTSPLKQKLNFLSPPRHRDTQGSVDNTFTVQPQLAYSKPPGQIKSGYSQVEMAPYPQKSQLSLRGSRQNGWPFSSKVEVFAPENTVSMSITGRR